MASRRGDNHRFISALQNSQIIVTDTGQRTIFFPARPTCFEAVYQAIFW
jgi:hypothetical protein